MNWLSPNFVRWNVFWISLYLSLPLSACGSRSSGTATTVSPVFPSAAPSTRVTASTWGCPWSRLSSKKILAKDILFQRIDTYPELRCWSLKTCNLQTLWTDVHVDYSDSEGDNGRTPVLTDCHIVKALSACSEAFFFLATSILVHLSGLSLKISTISKSWSCHFC